MKKNLEVWHRDQEDICIYLTVAEAPCRLAERPVHW